MFDLSRLDVVALCLNGPARTRRYQLLHAAGVRRIRLATDVPHARALMRVSAADFLMLDTADLGDAWAATVMELSEPVAVDTAAPDPNKYGLDAGASVAFAGDLDELLGDSPVAKGGGGRKPATAPVVLTTPTPTVDLVQHAAMLGVAAVVVTPIDAATLAQRLRATLRKLGAQAA